MVCTFGPFDLKMKVQRQLFIKKDSGTVRDELSLNGIDLWALAITIVIGGQYFGWNAGLAMGFGSFLIAFFLVAMGFLVLSFSLAELSGVVPFGGMVMYFVICSLVL